LAYERAVIGEGVDQKTLASIRELAGADESVAEVRKSLTMHFGPEEALLALDIRFKENLRSEEIAEAINRLEKKIHDQHKEINHIFIEAKALKKAKPSE
jgi:divalent metal cation (Fe/Co/Zn/Cd) transporter